MEENVYNQRRNVAADCNAEFFCKTRLFTAISHFVAKSRFQQLPNLKIRSLSQIKERAFQAGELLSRAEGDARILERNGAKQYV